VKSKTEIFDSDFLGNKINVGDEVIFTAPGYRALVIGKVITKAPKSCQIEYINDWNYPRDGGVKEVVRQGYDQIIKHSAADVKLSNDELADLLAYCARLSRVVSPNDAQRYCDFTFDSSVTDTLFALSRLYAGEMPGTTIEDFKKHEFYGLVLHQMLAEVRNILGGTTK
jgi:hypothetical protein